MIWFTPYVSRLRDVVLSIMALLLLLLSIYGVVFLHDLSQYGFINPVYMWNEFVAFHIFTFGLPYIAAAIVGWCFARSAPDVSEHF